MDNPLNVCLSLSLPPLHFLAVRLSAYDLIQSLCEESSLQSHCHSAIISAMDKHFQEATRHNSLYWWKVQGWPCLA